MKKLLLTGFEPFLDYPINPTMDIVNELSRSTIHSYEIVGEILPVHYKKSGKKLIETIKQIEPDAVISLGLGGQRHHINPERIAINCNDGPEDNHGYKPNGEKIIPGGKDGIFTTLPIQKMVKTLREAHLPASISNSAGTYLCNNVMYHAL